VERRPCVKHAFELDEKSGNHMWRDALSKEMHNVGIAFEMLSEGQPAPTGWKKVTGHLVWDLPCRSRCLDETSYQK
jgi:hypothetical protein